MKKIIISIFIVICLLLAGCAKTEYDLPLHQPAENISRIELSDHTSGERVVLLTLQGDEIGSFAEELNQLKSFRYYNDPPVENGYLSIFLYYKNGDVDILGTDICEAKSSEVYRDSWNYIDADDMWELFSCYVEEDLLPAPR